MALVSGSIGLGVPSLAHGIDAQRTRDAATFLATQFRLARQRAVMSSQQVAVVFDDVAGEIGVRVCRDTDRDGISRAEVTAGTDTCDTASIPISRRFEQVRVGYFPGVPGLDNEASASPLKFGVARMASFSPQGTATAGSVVLRGGRTAQFAVRVAGVTGRTRVLRFDAGRREWIE
jgi:type II secretory pathway pseudopilin PulG